jgi:hypothetical protein
LTVAVEPAILDLTLAGAAVVEVVPAGSEALARVVEVELVGLVTLAPGAVAAFFMVKEDKVDGLAIVVGRAVEVVIDVVEGRGATLAADEAAVGRVRVDTRGLVVVVVVLGGRGFTSEVLALASVFTAVRGRLVLEVGGFVTAEREKLALSRDDPVGAVEVAEAGSLETEGRLKAARLGRMDVLGFATPDSAGLGEGLGEPAARQFLVCEGRPAKRARMT